MAEIIPALLIESAKEFEEKLRLIESGTKTIQVDILDGSLFPNTTWFDAAHVGALRTEVEYELHLMVENPLPIIKEWKKHVPTLKRAIVHAEMERPVGAVLNEIKDHLHLETGLAINSETPLDQVHQLAHHIDMLLIMGVHPGFSGQDFVGDVIYKKIEAAREHFPDLPISVDGGVSKERIHELVNAGATTICAASAIFKNEDPKEALKELQMLTSTN